MPQRVALRTTAGVCTWCKAAFERTTISSGPRPTYCSASCRSARHNAAASPETKARWRAIAKNKWRPGYLIHCAVCDQQFVQLNGKAKYCSRTCRNHACYLQAYATGSRKKQEKDRYARLKRAFRESVDPAEVYDRDCWTCGLCGRGIPRVVLFPHPESPTIDHIVPLALGGLHEMANVQAAHFLCNSALGASVRGERRARQR